MYYILINENREEVVSLDGYELDISNWGSIKHGLLVAYILQYSDWLGDNVKMISDGSGLNERYYEITSNWKDRTDDFINDFNITLEKNQKRYKIKPLTVEGKGKQVNDTR